MPTIRYCFIFAILSSAISFGGCYDLNRSDGSSTLGSILDSPVKQSATPATQEPTITVFSHPNYQLPAQVSLCGEALDLNRKSVYERLDAEFTQAINHPAQVALWQRRAAMFFPLIEKELKAAGLPDDLKYLAVAESDLRPWVLSPAGALGIWQFMPPTARQYGVDVNKKIDKRQLPEELLRAAIQYFKYLHTKFGNWPLAMASYNAGEGRIAKALSAQGVDNYFDLDLPLETERYVYRIAAIKIVLENAGKYGLNKSIPPSNYQTPKFTERQVEISPPQTWPQVAKKLGYNYKVLRLLNPHIKHTPLSGKYTLRVPNAR